MERYLAKVDVVKSALRQLVVNVDEVGHLKKQLVYSATPTSDKAISMRLSSLLDETYLIISKMKVALQVLSTENYELALELISDNTVQSSSNHCPITEKSSLLGEEKKAGAAPLFRLLSLLRTCRPTPTTAGRRPSSSSSSSSAFPDYSSACSSNKTTTTTTTTLSHHTSTSTTTPFIPSCFSSSDSPQHSIDTKGGDTNHFSFSLSTHNPSSPLSTAPSSPRSPPPASSEYNARVNLYMGVALTFRDLVRDLQAKQAEYKAAATDKFARQVKYAYPDASREDVRDLMEYDMCGMAQHAMHRKLQQGMPWSEVKEELKSTYHDIKKLEHCVIQLHTMFVELSALVDQQSFKLEDIYKAVQEAKLRSETAKGQLAQAHKHQIAAGKTILWIFLFAAIILFLYSFDWVRRAVHA